MALRWWADIEAVEEGARREAAPPELPDGAESGLTEDDDHWRTAPDCRHGSRPGTVMRPGNMGEVTILF